MFGIGMTELIVILVIALLVIGPKKLPDVARSIGKGLREFRNATSGLKDELRMDDLEDLDVEEAVPLGDQQETDKKEEALKTDAAGAESSEDTSSESEADQAPPPDATPASEPPVSASDESPAAPDRAETAVSTRGESTPTPEESSDSGTKASKDHGG